MAERREGARVNPRTWGRGLRRRIPVSQVPAEVLALVDEREGGRTCADCKAEGRVPPPGEPLELDHKQALARGGDYHHLNLRFACRSHNRARRERKIDSTTVPAWLRRMSRRGAP